jgi:hypothetical protein
MTELVYTIDERRICWPDPDATCLNGGCGWCNTYPFRKLSTIERYAARAGVLPHRGNGEDDAVVALRYGSNNDFFNVETRTSKDNLRAYTATVGAEALRKMAEGMGGVGGAHGKKREVMVEWLMRYRRDVLDESFRKTRYREVR